MAHDVVDCECEDCKAHRKEGDRAMFGRIVKLACEYGWGTTKHGEPLDHFIEKALEKLL